MTAERNHHYHHHCIPSLILQKRDWLVSLIKKGNIIIHQLMTIFVLSSNNIRP